MMRFTSCERLAAELGTEDGCDPRRYFDRRLRHESRQTPTRKAWQLCRQVEKELSLILACSANPRLSDLRVLAVVPAPHSGRLRVTVSADSETHSRPDRELALLRATGWLREEVASAICRRRTPELVFELV